MNEIIEKSFFRSFRETLGIDITSCDELLKIGYISEIEIEGERNSSIYLVFEKELLIKASNIMLLDDNPDENTIVDLSKELTNIVVGLSKVIASDRNIHYDISTPNFLGEREFTQTYNSALCFKHEDKKCAAYIGTKLENR